MVRSKLLIPRFVEFIPERLEQGEIYLSIPYATAAHLCACGCGEKVVTPFSLTDWALVFEGDLVSLRPSIGNWSFPCRSHYVIFRNEVRWAKAWTKSQVEAGRLRDRRAKEEHFGEPRGADNAARPDMADERKRQPSGFLARIGRRLRR